jgi:hypothetical protein
MPSWLRDPSLYELEINSLFRELKNHGVSTKEYDVILSRIAKLQTMEHHTKSSVSKDTLAIVTANLLGIFMIIKHEHVNVITSRAMNLIMKPR